MARAKLSLRRGLETKSRIAAGRASLRLPLRRWTANRGREHFALFFLGPNDYVVQSRADLQAFSLPYQTRYWIDPFGPTIWFR